METKRIRTELQLEAKRLSDRQRAKTKIHLGAAFSRWRELRQQKGIKSDPELALFLLDRCAASPQHQSVASEAAHSPPPLMKKDIPDLAPHDVLVNVARLLCLFRRCGRCRGECVVRKYGDKRRFSVIQQCLNCSQLTKWASQPVKEEEEPVGLCEVTEGDREFTACLIVKEWRDSETDTASSREDCILTDEDPPAELVETKEWVTSGDQEPAASLTARTTVQTDGGPSRKTSLLTEDNKQGNAQESENRSDPSAEVELTVDSDFTEGSQRDTEDSDEVGDQGRSQRDAEDSDWVPDQEGSQSDTEDSDGVGDQGRSQRDTEDIDGGGDQEGSQRDTEDIDGGGDQEEGQGGVGNQNIKQEEGEDTGEPETQEEEDEWEMDVEDDEDDDDEEWGEDIKKILKRDPLSPHHRRKRLIRSEQKRPESLCPDCGRLYRTLSHKCDPKMKFQCPDCGLYCQSELSFRVHRNELCSRRVQPCMFCFKPFRTRKDRLTHEMSHAEEEPYECPECPLRFLDRSTRSRHLKEHRQRYTCQTCRRDFPELHLLHRHEMSHSSKKPFSCQVCDRMFAQASQLKSHLRVHTGEKPFQCQLCPQRFNHNVSLKNHAKRHHQGETRDGSGTRGAAKLRTGPSGRRSEERT